MSWLLDPLQSLPLASSCFQLSFFLLRLELPKTLSSINPGQALTCHAILLLVWLTPFLAPYRRKLLLAALVLGRFALSEVLLGAAREVPAAATKFDYKSMSSGETMFGEFVATASHYGVAVIVVQLIMYLFNSFLCFFLQRMYGIDSVDGI